MEPILDYLKRRLKEAGPAAWPGIAAAISVKFPPEKPISEHALRKLAYGDRENPGLQYAQALLDHFGPPPMATKAKKGRGHHGAATEPQEAEQ